jgi:hypothetical protein
MQAYQAVDKRQQGQLTLVIKSRDKPDGSPSTANLIPIYLPWYVRIISASKPG